jgi:hypothetical protein
MPLGRVVLLLLFALAVGAGAILTIEGNTTPVSLHLGSSAAHIEVPLWLIITFAFVGGAMAASVLAGSFWLIGPFYYILIGGLFALALSAAVAVLGVGTAAAISLLIGLLLLLVAMAWERRADLAAAAAGIRTCARASWSGILAGLKAVHAELTAWVQDLSSTPPAIAPPPPSVIGLIIVLLLASVLLGSTILVRTALVLTFAAAGIVAALRAITMVGVGIPIELRARYGGLGGGQGGWRLSRPASLLLIAAILLGAAVGLAQVDRGFELTRPVDGKLVPEPTSKRGEPEKAPEAATPASSTPARH